VRLGVSLHLGNLSKSPRNDGSEGSVSLDRVQARRGVRQPGTHVAGQLVDIIVLRTPTVSELFHEGSCSICSICLCEFEPTAWENPEFYIAQQLRALSCGHLFHTTCIEQWLTVKRACPFRCSLETRRVRRMLPVTPEPDARGAPTPRFVFDYRSGSY